MSESEDDEKPDTEPEPSMIGLIVKGLLIICGAFVSATVILIMHQPVGH